MVFIIRFSLNKLYTKIKIKESVFNYGMETSLLRKQNNYAFKLVKLFSDSEKFTYR